MKNKNLLILAAAALSLSINAHEHNEGQIETILKKSPVILSAVTALEEFKSGFESGGKRLSTELIGFASKEVDGEAEVSVFNIPQSGRIQNANFDCHYHSHGGQVDYAHCHNLGSSNKRNFVAPKGSMSVSMFREVGASTIGLFEKLYGNPANIKYAKFWRSYSGNEANIHVKLHRLKPNGKYFEVFFYCHEHKHGNKVEVDCHRQRSAGPNQP